MKSGDVITFDKLPDSALVRASALIGGATPVLPFSMPDCPHGDIIRLWGEKLPSAVQPRTWIGARADALKARWREDPDRQSLDWWAGFFEHIEKSDFLMGRTSGRDRGPFSITLDWLCDAKNFAKALDGFYDNKQPQGASFLQGCL